MKKYTIDEVVNDMVRRYNNNEKVSYYIWGEPNTGKSATAHKLAKALNCNLYFKDLSGLWNDYVDENVILMRDVHRLYCREKPTNDYLADFELWSRKLPYNSFPVDKKRNCMIVNPYRQVLVLTSVDPPETLIQGLCDIPYFVRHEYERFNENFCVIHTDRNYFQKV